MSSEHVFFKLKFPESDPKFRLPPKIEILARHDADWHSLTGTITESLFNSYIDDLIRELEEIRQEGRTKFSAAKN
jgi:hypothetical protein